jgi:hypothetical protein
VSGRTDKIGPEVPSWRDLRVFSGYVACAAVYITVGVFETDFLLSFWVALAYLLLMAWAVPAAVRRLRRS